MLAAEHNKTTTADSDVDDCDDQQLSRGAAAKFQCTLFSLQGKPFIVNLQAAQEWHPRLRSLRSMNLSLNNEALKLFVDVIDGTDTKETVTSTMLVMLAGFAKYYQSEKLLKYLIETYYSVIEGSATVPFWLLSRERNLSCQVEIRRKVGCEIISAITDRREPCSHLQSVPASALIELLGDDEIKWKSSDDCLYMLIWWTKKNGQMAILHRKSLFSAIRFSSIQNQREAKRRYIEILETTSPTFVTAKDIDFVSFSSIRPRLPDTLVLMFYGSEAFAFNHATGRWFAAGHFRLPANVEERVVGFVTVNDVLYLVLSDGRVYASDDDVNKKWKLVVSIFENKTNYGIEIDPYIVAAAEYNCQIAVINPNGHVWFLDPLTSKVTCQIAVCAQEIPLSSAVIQQGDLLIVTGGITKTPNSPNPEASSGILAFKNHVWTPCQPLKKPRFGHGIVSYKGRTYVIGGCNKDGDSQISTEVYDTKIGGWMTAPSLVYARKTVAAVSTPFGIFVGGSSPVERSVVELFDGESWRIRTGLPQCIKGSSIASKKWFMAACPAGKNIGRIFGF